MNRHFLVALVLLPCVGCQSSTSEVDEPPKLGAPYSFPAGDDASSCDPNAPEYTFCDWVSSADIVFSGVISDIRPITTPVLHLDGNGWQPVSESECTSIYSGLDFSVRVSDVIGNFNGSELSFTRGGVEMNVSHEDVEWFDDGFKFPNGSGFGRGQTINGLLHRLDDGSYSLLRERLFTFRDGRIEFPTRSPCIGLPPTELSFASFEDVRIAAAACDLAPRSELRRSAIRLVEDGVFKDAAMCGSLDRPEAPGPMTCRSDEDCVDGQTCGLYELCE